MSSFYTFLREPKDSFSIKISLKTEKKEVVVLYFSLAMVKMALMAIITAAGAAKATM
jgi:hypothetical protein